MNRTATLGAMVTAALAMVSTAGVASADSISMTFTGLGPAKVVGVNFNSSRTFNAGPVNSFSYYWSGLMKWNTAFGQRTTFCTQINEHVWGGLTVNYDIVDVSQVPDNDPAPGPMGTVKAQLMRDLYARFYTDVVTGGNATLNSAFQLAIWEIGHENITAGDAAGAQGQLSLALGALQVNSGYSADVVGAANDMLAQLGGSARSDWRTLDGDHLFGLSNGLYQDQLMVVPVPAVAGLAALGLGGVLALRRRMK